MPRPSVRPYSVPACALSASRARPARHSNRYTGCAPVSNRTAHVNEIRGLLAEYGIEIPQGRQRVGPAVAQVLGDGGTTQIPLPPLFLEVLGDLYDELVHMEARVERYDARITSIARSDEQARLLMISKRGDRYVRCLLIHGARAVVRRVDTRQDPRSQWLQRLLERRHRNVATVALANRMARTAWAVLATGKPYEEHYVPG